VKRPRTGNFNIVLFCPLLRSCSCLGHKYNGPMRRCVRDSVVLLYVIGFEKRYKVAQATKN